MIPSVPGNRPLGPHRHCNTVLLILMLPSESSVLGQKSRIPPCTVCEDLGTPGTSTVLRRARKEQRYWAKAMPLCFSSSKSPLWDKSASSKQRDCKQFTVWKSRFRYWLRNTDSHLNKLSHLWWCLKPQCKITKRSPFACDPTTWVWRDSGSIVCAVRAEAWWL